MRLCLLAVLVLLARPTTAPTPTGTPTATAVATATPYPTYTPFPTYTAVPSATAVRVGSQMQNGQPGWCLIGCFSWTDLFGSMGNGFVGWLIDGINAIVDAVAELLTALVRVDQWSELHAFFQFLRTVGAGMAGGLAVVGALRYYRSFLPGGHPFDGAAGLGMLTRTLETAALLLALDWGVSQILDGGQAFAATVTGYTGTMGASLLTGMMSVFATGGLTVITILLGIVAALVYALIVLVKLGSVAALAWLYILAPLVMPTWTLSSGIVVRWFWAFVSVALWGTGWGLWLKISLIVLTDYTVNPVLKPFEVVALLIFGYGVPRAVDTLLQASATAMSGAYTMANAVVGATMGGVIGASQYGVSRGIRNAATWLTAGWKDRIPF